MNRAASEGHGLLAESDTEDASGGGSKWDRVRALQASEKPGPGSPSLLRSLSERLSMPEVAASAHLRYDAEQWLPTIRASFDTVGSFVVRPLLLLTALTAVMTFASNFFKHAPWWTTMPAFAHTVLGGCLSFLCEAVLTEAGMIH